MNLPLDSALQAPLGLPVVYLVDDEDVVRDALAWLLRSRRLLSEGFASADAFEAWLAPRLGHGDVPTAVAAVKRGAFDFVEKPFSNNSLVDRIEQALHVSAQALLARRQQQQAARALAELTEREREVMRLVIEGRPNKLIADELAISVRTVEVHRARVFEKLNVKSAVELANKLRTA